jgi:hypothetical protein
MAGKQRGSAASRAVSALVGAGAAFATRKLLTIGWKTVTGKEPPEHPEDPQVALGEALIWGVALGAAVASALAPAITSPCAARLCRGPANQDASASTHPRVRAPDW